MAETMDRRATETMENFTIRMPASMRRQIEELARKDRRRASDWARLQIERAIEQALEDDETGDVPHEQVVAEMWTRGMITPESEALAAQLTDDDFKRAQEEYEREQRWT